MAKRIAVKSLTILMMIALTIGSLEGVLRVADPWGVGRYARDMVVLRNSYQSHPDRGYVLPDGRYDFPHWTVTIENGTRIVPDSSRGDCRIVFVGDSLTFGYGVNDADTYANRLAQQWSNVTVLNAGVIGYNLLDVLHTIAAIPADGYIYTSVHNDADAAYRPTPGEERYIASLSYLQFAVSRMNRRVSAAGVPEWYTDALPLLERPDILVLAYPSSLTDVLLQSVPGVVFPLYTQVNSAADGHPNAAGHRQIADAISGSVTVFVQDRCAD